MFIGCLDQSVIKVYKYKSMNVMNVMQRFHLLQSLFQTLVQDALSKVDGNIPLLPQKW